MPRSIVTSTSPVQGLGMGTNNPILCINKFIETGPVNTTLTEGMVGVLDLAGRALISGANPTTTFSPGDSASALAQVRAPTADDRDAGIYLLVAKQPDEVTSLAVGDKGLFHLWARQVLGLINNDSGATLDKSSPRTAVYGNSAANFEEMNVPLTVTAGSRRIAVTDFLSATSTASIANAATGLFPVGIFDGFGLFLGQELI